ncbi:MAG: hypothetical protein A2V79_00560 [Betaproteobacteria bacterium RBG_16_56_24]|nr:MAG: hypothetical protein A2V79_00560 [Betaproteobacteria bacterium RBG_16_56_24]
MKKLLTVLSLVVALPTAALAAEGADGSCGVGSMIFKGQSGVAPQVLAITTNGTFGNQTFGVTTGTLGCSPNATVKSNMKSAMFIDSNKDQLARDMSVGSGETLASLSHLLGVEAKDQAAFNRLAKNNVARIFTTDSVATEQVISALREVLASDATLSHYQAAL